MTNNNYQTHKNKLWHKVPMAFLIALMILPLSSTITKANDTNTTDVTLTTVWNKVKSISNGIKKMGEELNKGTQAVASNEITKLLSSAKGLIDLGLILPDSNWEGNNGTCSIYKADLKSFLSLIPNLGNDIASSAGINANSLDIAILINNIDAIPCFVLFPSYLIFEDGSLKISDIVYQLQNIQDGVSDVAGLLAAANPLNKAQSSVSLLKTEGSVIELSAECELYRKNTLAFKIAKQSIHGGGIFLKLVGAIFKSLAETIAAGPTEASGAVWGWVGGTVKNNLPKAVGIAVDGLGTLAIKLAGKAGEIMTDCELLFLFDDISVQINSHDYALETHDIAINSKISVHDDEVQTKVSIHDTDVKAKISTHDEDIKARLDYISAGQQEIIRLLLTPQGRRDSDFCTDEDDDCDFTGASGNDNGNSDDKGNGKKNKTPLPPGNHWYESIVEWFND